LAESRVKARAPIQAVALLVGGAAPVLGTVLFLVIPDLPFSLSTLGVTVGSIAWAMAIFRYRLLDVVPVAQDALFERMEDWMLVTDLDDRVMSVNPSFCRFLGVAPSDVLGRPAREVLGAHPPLVAALDERCETRREITLGACHHDLRIGRVTDRRDRHGGWLLLLRDITERVHMEQALAEERDKSEKLLLNILPQPIAERLKRGGMPISDGFAEASVLFADIVDFTPFSERLTPHEIVATLDTLFTLLDGLAERHGVEKIKTVGDAWMAACGVPEANARHLETMADLSLAMLNAVKDLNTRSPEPLSLRIGLNCGPVVAGVIGAKRLIYDLWGDTVNTASRMESHGLPGRIQVTEAVWERLRDRYVFEARGPIRIKGKGEMRTWFLLGRRPDGPEAGHPGHTPPV